MIDSPEPLAFMLVRGQHRARGRGARGAGFTIGVRAARDRGRDGGLDRFDRYLQ